MIQFKQNSYCLIRFIFIFFLTTFLVFPNSHVQNNDPSFPAEQRFTSAEIISDLRYVLKMIQDVHPDPYSGFGGRVEFQLEAQRIRNKIPKDGLTSRNFYDLLRQFFGKMKDGHSYIYAPSSQTNKIELLYLPMKFKVALDAVFIAEAQEQYKDIIGYRLKAVENMSLADLQEAAGNIYPRENEYAASHLVISLLNSTRSLRGLIPTAGKEITFSFLNEENSEVTIKIPYSLSPADLQICEWKGNRWNKIQPSDSLFFYRLFPEYNAAYFRISTVMGREAFEIMKASGRTDLEISLNNFYKRTLKKNRPQNINDAIAGVPSVTKTAFKLLTAMKKHMIKHLIIDLKGNSGGWSAIMRPFYYMLYGDRYFKGKDPVFFATRISERFLKINGETLESFNRKRKSSYELGDIFVTQDLTQSSAQVKRKQYLSDLRRQRLSCLDYLESLNGSPVHSPEVYVITDPGTFSAAYDLMYRLRRLGAKIVGVPPAQSANTFVDTTPFELQNTKLRGTLSRTAVIIPDMPEVNGAFIPEYPLKWEDFQKYKFNQHSEVLFILNLIREEVR